MAEILSFVGQKGGVGKSTLSLCVSLALADIGKRVLFIDFDPQRSSSKFFYSDDNFPKLQLEHFVCDGNFNAISKSEFNLIDVIVTSTDDRNLNHWYADEIDSVDTLHLLLQDERIQSVYDVVIIDTQGSEWRRTAQEMVLYASTKIVSPTLPNSMSADELDKLFNIYLKLDKAMKRRGYDVPALHFVVNRDTGTKTAKTITQSLRSELENISDMDIKVLNTVIPSKKVWEEIKDTRIPPYRAETDTHNERSGLAVMRNLMKELFPNFDFKL